MNWHEMRHQCPAMNYFAFELHGLIKMNYVRRCFSKFANCVAVDNALPNNQCSENFKIKLILHILLGMCPQEILLSVEDCFVCFGTKNRTQLWNQVSGQIILRFSGQQNVPEILTTWNWFIFSAWGQKKKAAFVCSNYLHKD